MVDERKVRLMTRLSIYEKHEKNRNLVLSRYYKTDYVRYNVLKTWIAATVAFWSVVGLYVMMSFDDILAEINDVDYFDVMYKFLAAYVIFCAVLMLFANLVYKYRYSKAKPGLVKYNSMLKDLIELQGGPIHRTKMVANSEVKVAAERQAGTNPNRQNPQSRVNRSEVVKRRMEQEEKNKEQQIIENVKQRNERIAAQKQAELQRQQQMQLERQRLQQRRQQLEQEQMARLRNEYTQQTARENHVYRGTNDANGRKER